MLTAHLPSGSILDHTKPARDLMAVALLGAIGGGIAFMMPFDIEWVTVSATQSHWILSFLLYWTFALELVIWAIVGTLFWRQLRKGQT